jgi:serine O-acetyltransferase
VRTARTDERSVPVGWLLSALFVPVLLGPGVSAVFLYRLSRGLQRLRLSPLAYAVARLNHLVHGVEVPPTVSLGPGLTLSNPQGVVLHGEVVVGARCTIGGQVVLGVRKSGSRPAVGPPRIGNGVVIGAGAKLLGDVFVGDGAEIAAQSVVLVDVPAGAYVEGVPAVVIEGHGRATRRPAPPCGGG